MHYGNDLNLSPQRHAKVTYGCTAPSNFISITVSKLEGGNWGRLAGGWGGGACRVKVASGGRGATRNAAVARYGTICSIWTHQVGSERAACDVRRA